MTSEEKFFADLNETCAHLMQMALMGQNLDKLAERLGCSVNYLYQCTYPDKPQVPNLKKFFLILKDSPQKMRIIRHIARGLGFDLDGLARELRSLASRIDEKDE